MSGESNHIEIEPPGSRWASGDYVDVALINVTKEQIERCFGAPLISGEEEGLGPWIAIGGKLRSGVQIELVEHRFQPVKGFVLRVDSGCNPETALKKVLALLGIGVESIKWRKSAPDS